MEDKVFLLHCSVSASIRQSTQINFIDLQLPDAVVDTLMGITLLLGISFLTLEIMEFTHLLHAGHTFTASAFLSSFFGLVATHGIHVLLGCLWLVGLAIQVMNNKVDDVIARKVRVFSLFWHFLDIVWVFVFTFVYLFGVIK